MLKNLTSTLHDNNQTDRNEEKKNSQQLYLAQYIDQVDRLKL